MNKAVQAHPGAAGRVERFTRHARAGSRDDGAQLRAFHQRFHVHLLQHGVDVDMLYEGGFDGVLSVEHEDPVWGGTEEKVEIGLRIAHHTLRPLLVA